jgi:hypothetical protein
MIEKLTKKQVELMSTVRDEWIDLGLHGKLNKEEAEAGVKWIYYASSLREPEVVFATGPKSFSKVFGASVRASVGASVWSSVRASVGASVAYTSTCYDSDNGSVYDFCQRSGIIKHQEEVDKYIGFLKSGAFYCMFFEKKAFVMCSPKIVKQDEQKRLHSTTQAALEFVDGTKIYKIHGVDFDTKLWKTVTSPDLTPKQVFAIENTEQRRIAYELMDKLKMKELDNYTVLEDSIDDSGNPQKIVSFNIDGFDKPFITQPNTNIDKKRILNKIDSFRNLTK